MPYSRISHTRNGADALRYALNGKGHTKGKARNLLVGYVGFLPDGSMPILRQCERLWGKASSRNKTQMRRIVVSFSPNELPSDAPDSPVKALEIAMEIAKRGYKGHPFVLAVQNDGTGGKIHVHMLSPNVNMITHRGFTDDQTKHWYLKQLVDEICSEYFEPDTGRSSFEKVSQNERRKREENKALIKANEGVPAEEQKPLNYIWKDDLKRRIREAMSEAVDQYDFFKRLMMHGVKGEFRNTKKQGDFIIYELTDTSGFTDKIPSNLKSKSYKLGAGFGIEALKEELQRNATPSNGIQTDAEAADTGTIMGKEKDQEKVKKEMSAEPQPDRRKLPRRPASLRNRTMIECLEADRQLFAEGWRASDSMIQK